MKHIKVDFHFVRERVANGELRVKHVSSQEQLADALQSYFHAKGCNP